MKLNAGCGFNKLEGYINIDINPKCKPDYVMPLWNLDFESELFNEVLASQVIEHLGYFKTRYFFSEIARVLKYEKIFIVETVDIEESFRIFLESKNKDDRERILAWIFGSETKYMNHIYCFPYELIEKMLNDEEFEIIEKKQYLYEHLRPAIKIVAIKRKKDLRKCFLRKELINLGVLDEEDEIALSECERIIKEINLDKIDELFVDELCFISPSFAIAVSKIIKKGNIELYNELLSMNFQGYILWLFEKYLKAYRDFDFAFNKIKKDFFENPSSFIDEFKKNRNARSTIIKPPFLITEKTLHQFIKTNY